MQLATRVNYIFSKKDPEKPGFVIALLSVFVCLGD